MISRNQSPILLLALLFILTLAPLPLRAQRLSEAFIARPELVFGFIGENRYSYCPSIIRMKNGDIHMFFCGNPDPNVMVDNIYHIVNSHSRRSQAVSVLQPSDKGAWDDHHTCDPSVIEGRFRMNGKTYKYAMFYLGCNQEWYYNEIGVAFSNSLSSDSWTKYPSPIVHKPWKEPGDCLKGNGTKAWGVGQPSAVSLDRKGKVLLTYTIGDKASTRQLFSICDFSDMGKPAIGESKVVSTDGLIDMDGRQDYISNADIAIDRKNDRIVMIRTVHMHSVVYPTYISRAVDIDWMKLSDFMRGEGSWTLIARVGQAQTSFPANHNAGLLRDPYGNISDWEHPVFYFTSSKVSPDVSPEFGKHAEWTYHIYRSQVLGR
jgi:hypothetical protein